MIYLLYIAVGYLIITSVIFFFNRRDFTPLLPAKKNVYDNQAPFVSICIPARNEEAVIQRCVESALSQEYPNFEVIVLDDESTDSTPYILEKVSERFSNKFKVIKGNPKPDSWLGKPWACHQLANEASGNILIFIDADTRPNKKLVSKIVRTMGHDVIGFLTIWPQQKLLTFWEKTVIPLVYYALLTLLPARYVYKNPKVVPKFLRPSISPLFAAACGQCMAFKRSVYDAINGHESVKDEVVEDVALAKRIKEKGYKMKMYHGEDSISCRMYTSQKEMREGFGKNFLAGFNYNIPLFTLMAVLHIIVFIFPFIALPFGIILQNATMVILSGLAVILILYQRLLLAGWFDWDFAYALLHPLGVLWFQKLGAELMHKYITGKKNYWKGRSVD